MDSELRRNLILRLEEIITHLEDNFFHDYAIDELKRLLEEIKKEDIKPFVEPFYEVFYE